MLIALSLALVVLASVIIMFACNSFEEGSDHLGRNMPPGVQGATINAIASSLPELLTTTFLLFVFRDVDGFSGGIATCAGSAVFNAVIIPSLCLMAVLVWGVKRDDGTIEKVQFITVGKGTVIRDGLFFILAEVMLIAFLGNTTLTWVAGAMLLVAYGVYFTVLMTQYKLGHLGKEDEDGDEDGDEDEDEDGEPPSKLVALVTFDINQLVFNGQPLNDTRAWVVLGGATAVIAGACFMLSWSVVTIAAELQVPLYFTTVILAAAATSVPDTVISVKDALGGDYDDAVSNAIGSNIFDICVALGLPLLVYTLVYGPVTLTSSSGAANADVQELRVALLAITGILMGIFLIGNKIGKLKAGMMLALYGVWTGFIIYRAMQAAGTV